MDSRKKNNPVPPSINTKTTALRLLQLFLLVLISVSQWECKPKQTSPKAPMEEYKYSDKEIQNEKHLSVVNLPIELPVSEIENQVNAKIKGLIFEDNSYEDDNQDNFKAKVWKLSPMKVVAIDSSFLFEVPLKIWVSAGYKIAPLGVTMSGYKDTEFSIRIRLISKVGIHSNWQIRSETYVDSYDWITEPSIKVAGINIPIKALVSRMLNKNFAKITEAIDEEVANNIELKKNAEMAWNLVRQPVMLSKEYDTWLVVVPTGVVMTPLLAKNGILRASIGIKGYTQTITSTIKPVAPASQKLPDLQIVDKVPGDFKIGLISLISYEDAARLATSQMKGQQFSFLGGQYNVEVTSIEMYGQNDRLVIKAGLSGSMNGFIYFKGTPHYDPETQQLSMKNLDYDLETRNSIIRTANWLLQGQFTRMIEKRMVFPIGDQMSDAKQTISKALSSYKVTDGVVVRGKLTDIQPDKVYLTPKHLYSVVFATGNVNLRVDGLKGM